MEETGNQRLDRRKESAETPAETEEFHTGTAIWAEEVIPSYFQGHLFVLPFRQPLMPVTHAENPFAYNNIDPGPAGPVAIVTIPQSMMVSVFIFTEDAIDISRNKHYIASDRVAGPLG